MIAATSPKFALFATQATPVNMLGLGIVNGYKINEVIHNGRRVCLRAGAYYYVPQKKAVVSYRGSRARVMVINELTSGYNMQERDGKGFSRKVNVDASSLHLVAHQVFG